MKISIDIDAMQAAARAGYSVLVVVNGEFYEFSADSADDNREEGGSNE